MSRAGKIGIGLHSAIDVGASTVTYSPPVNDEDIDIDRDTIDDDETLGDRAPGEVAYGGRIFKGGVNLSVRPVSFGALVTSFMGPPTSTNLIGAHALSTAFAPASIIADGGRLYEATQATSGTTASTKPAGFGTTTTGATITDGSVTWTDRGASTGVTLYRHVWDPMLANPQFMTLWARDPDPGTVLLRKFVGGLGNEMELRAETNNFMKARAAWFFRQLIQNSADPAMTSDAGKRFPFGTITAQLSVAGGALGAVQLRDWRFNFNNNLEDDQFVLGSYDVDSIPIGDMGAEARFRPTRNIPDWFARAMADVPENVRLLLTALGPAIVGTVTNRVEVDLPKLQTLTAPVPIEAGSTRRDVEVTARAVKDPTTNTPCKATIVNTEDGTKYRAA